MDYLTVTEMAKLKKCSISYISRLIKTNKIPAESTLNPETNKIHSLIPVSALPEDLQAKYYKQKRTETGVMPGKTESENSSETAFKYRLKDVSKAFEELSETERLTIIFWIDLLNEWQGERSRRKDKTEFDKLFVAHQKYVNPDIEISTDILYRKYSAYQNECYGDLIDKRGGWNKGKSKLNDDSIIWQSFLSVYLRQSKPNIALCYRMVTAYIAEEHPELVGEIPSVSCFRRKIEKLPFAVLEYSHNGEKAMHDHCIPSASRRKDEIYANDGWVMDNYTFDVIVKQDNNSRRTRRLYITTVLDVKSNVLVGWNITESPDSNSTLDALQFAMLRFGIPKRLYFDNGREFTALDIAGEQRNRRVAKAKKGNVPITIAEKLGVELIFAKVTNA